MDVDAPNLKRRSHNSDELEYEESQLVSRPLQVVLNNVDNAS